MNDPIGAEFASRSEEELHEMLGLVRRESPEPTVALPTAIAQTLRWQAAAALPLAAAVAIVGGLAAGLRALAGSGSRS